MIDINQKSNSELILSTEEGKYYINSYIDEHGEPFISYSKILKVKIIKGGKSKWYDKKIGEVFEVVKEDQYYDVISFNGIIFKEDVIELTD